MIRSAPSISTIGPAGPSRRRKYGNRSASRAARSCSARSCPRTFAKTSMAVGIARVRLRERGRPSGLVLARPPRVRRAPVPAALYLRRLGASAASVAALLPDALAEPAVLARRRAALPGLARRERGGPDQRPVRRSLRGSRHGHVRLPGARGRPGHPAAPAGGRRVVAAGPGPRAHDRPDGLHDERRVRRPDRRLRADAVHQAAVAPPVLRAAL